MHPNLLHTNLHIHLGFQGTHPRTRAQESLGCVVHRSSGTLIGENRRLVTNEPVEFEKQPVETQDRMKITDHLRGIYIKIFPHLSKENKRMSTCNRLDLQTLGSQPIMPKQTISPITIPQAYHRSPSTFKTL